VAGQGYVLKWAVTQNGVTNEDYVNVSFASSFTVTPANAGADQNNITTIVTTLTGNAPVVGETGAWTIVSGSGGVITNPSNPNSLFTGVQGQSYTLRWRIAGPCVSNQDDVILYFSPSAAGTVSSSGKYYIPDGTFRLILQILYPSYMNGDSLIVSSATGIKRLNLGSKNVKNLDGLQHFTTLRYLDVSSNSLSTLSNLPNSLDSLICGSNGLNSLPPLPTNLKYLSCGSNNLTSLPSLPANLTYLSCGNNYSLASLPSLPASLTYLSCSSNYLSALPSLPSSLTYLNCNSNYLTSLPSLPASLITLYCHYNNLSSLPSLPTSLKELVCYSNSNLSVLPALPSGLTTLSCSYTSLLKLPFLPSTINSGFLSVPSSLICVTNKPANLVSTLSTYPICP
jgi:Leucine-rich repeat (LRR) protein